jgi:hypothetical protein
MVALVFDASRHAASAADRQIRLTFGRSRSEVRWQDQREMTFGEMADILSVAPVGGKDGACYTPAIFTGQARRMEQAARIDVAVLDADCGHSLEEICAALRAKGWRAIVHSTYSHLSDQSVVSAGAAEKWLGDSPGRDIAGYMLAKKGYLPRVVAGAKVVDETRDGNARNLIVQHNQCPKFRIVLPLDQPWVAEEFDSQALANAKWRERIGSLAHALGLHHDQSCVDTSRLFYLPRRRDTDQPFEHIVLDGDDCPLWALPDAAAATESTLFDAPATVPQSAPRLHVVNADHKTWTSPDGEWVDLTAWAAKYATRFEVVTALRAKAPGVFSSRRSGVKHHLICPNAGDHFSGGAEGTGTYAVNASQVAHAGLPAITSGFVINCMHNGCSGHDRLDHVRGLLSNGSLSISDLTCEAFLTPDIPQVDPAALIRSEAKKPLAAAPEIVDSGNIAPALYANLPGALGAMHAWILATSAKPQPALALGAALAFSASAIGQRVQLQRWGTRPNIYVLAVAHSGAGKERPQSACKMMARSAGLFSDMIGVEEVASDTGIVNAVMRAPRQVMLIDEVSFLLNATSNRQAGPHLANVIGTLLKLYSSSHTTYQSKSYADTEKVKTIDQPCVSFYGSSTPAGLTEALTSRDITSGLLSRMVLFDAGDRDPRISPAAQDPVPAAIIDWLTAWNKVSPTPNPVARVGGEVVMAPRTVMVTEEAADLATAFEGEMHAAKIAARKRGTDALYVRALENALKFALIRACAVLPVKSDAGPVVDESALRVDAATMRWAVELSRATVARMDQTTGEIADGPFQQSLKALRQVIRRGGEKGVTMRDISRSPAGKHPKKMLDDLLESLAAAGDAFWVTRIKTKTKPRDAWVHRDFIKHHAPSRAEEDDDEAE